MEKERCRDNVHFISLFLFVLNQVFHFPLNWGCCRPATLAIHRSSSQRMRTANLCFHGRRFSNGALSLHQISSPFHKDHKGRVGTHLHSALSTGCCRCHLAATASLFQHFRKIPVQKSLPVKTHREHHASCGSNQFYLHLFVNSIKLLTKTKHQLGKKSTPEKSDQPMV